MSKRTVASIVTSTDAVSPAQAFSAGLRLHLAPGWHVYWQNPGDAGIPPELTLAKSPDTYFGPIAWPSPSRISEGSLTTYGYTGDVVLPFAVTPGAGTLTIDAHAEWLVCRDICVPEEANLSLALPPGKPNQAVEAGMIADAIARSPTPAPFDVSVSSAGVLSVLGATTPNDYVSAEFFPLKPGLVERAASQPLQVSGGSLQLHTDLSAGTTGASANPGVLTLTTRSGSKSAYSVSPRRVADIEQAQTPLLPLIVLALTGGLLLNLMPCVFPILAMKAMALVRSGSDARRFRTEAASYTAGVVITFTGLGAALVGLRAAGAASGWGFQFQSPIFVTCVAWLLFGIGLSLSGVFDIGASLTGRGTSLARRNGHLGSFATGILAVVVAAPCTAPFMGTAIAGALLLPNAGALTVFMALGFGLALPYALIACVPRLSRVLPRPGPWMRVLQQLLAFPMYAACLWLVWVISQQSGPTGVLAAGAGLVTVGFGGWTLGIAGRLTGWVRPLAKGASLASIAALAVLLYASRPSVAPSDPVEPFTTARLDELRTQGRPVFVNMTAAWCLSCLVNERVALSTSAVQAAFAQDHVAYLKGDWTSQNAAISDYLHQLGRDGVPLYVLYAPGRAPLVLPQLLTEGAILDQLAKLKG